MVDGTGFPKHGEDSVGVDRQYSGTLGKTGNCQVAVNLHHVGEQGNAVLGWRLCPPESWTKDSARRKATRVPKEVVFRKKWELALDLLDPMPPGRYSASNGGEVELAANSRLSIVGSTLLAGAARPLIDCIGTTARLTGLPLLSVLQMATLHPGRVAPGRVPHSWQPRRYIAISLGP